MIQYINKADVKAEIEKLEERFTNQDNEFSDGYHFALKLVLSFIDTLEVKEVKEEPVPKDLEKVFDKYSEELESDYSNDMFDRGDIFIACKFGAQQQALHSLETIKEMEEQAFLAGVEAEQINKSFSKEELEELLNRRINKL
jgi:hypothetical protein